MRVLQDLDAPALRSAFHFDDPIIRESEMSCPFPGMPLKPPPDAALQKFIDDRLSKRDR